MVTDTPPQPDDNDEDEEEEDASQYHIIRSHRASLEAAAADRAAMRADLEKREPTPFDSLTTSINGMTLADAWRAGVSSERLKLTREVRIVKDDKGK